MKSKSKGVKVEKCMCDKCGETANAQPSTPHAFCRGFRLLKPLPPMFAKLRNPVKGTWLPVGLWSDAMNAKVEALSTPC
jgi:hypothetical protein